MSEIFTSTYFHNLFIYGGILIFIFVNIFFITHFLKTGDANTITGLIYAIVSPFLIIVFLEIFQALLTLDSFASIISLAILINLITYFVTKQKLKKKKQTNEFIFKLYNSRHELLKAIHLKLEEDKKYEKNNDLLTSLRYDLLDFPQRIERYTKL